MGRITLGRITILVLSVCCVALAEPRFVYPLPPPSAVAVQSDVVYKTVGERRLHFDLYRPANHNAGSALPVAIFMQGVGSGDVRKWAQYIGWGKLVTTIGMAGVVYDSHEGAVSEDAADLLAYLRQHATDLHVDAGNVVLWACSSNVRAGLPFAMDPRQTAIKAAVIYYGVTEEVKDIRMDLPVLLVRAGLDGAGLNRGIDQLVTRASAINAPVTFINVPAAHHAFDILDDNDTSRAVIARTLDFMKTQVQPSAQREIQRGVAEATAAGAVYRGDWSAAVKAYEALAASHPKDSEIHRNYGNALYGAGQYRPAVDQYKLALELGNPNVGWVSYSAASSLMKLGERDAAMEWIEKLRDIPPMTRRLGSDPDFAPLRDNPRFKEIAGQK